MRMPEEVRAQEEVRELESWGCLTRMHVIRLPAPTLAAEDHQKDIDFSRKGIAARREAGYAHAMQVLEIAPWNAPVDPLEGFVLHEIRG